MKPNYRGVPYPDVMLPNLDQHEAVWFRVGVDSALSALGVLHVTPDWAGPGFTVRNDESTT